MSTVDRIDNAERIAARKRRDRKRELRRIIGPTLAPLVSLADGLDRTANALHDYTVAPWEAAEIIRDHANTIRAALDAHATEHAAEQRRLDELNISGSYHPD
jgi:hypothetical protein